MASIVVLKITKLSHYLIQLWELLIDLKTNIAWLIIKDTLYDFTEPKQLYYGQNKSLQQPANTKWQLQ